MMRSTQKTRSSSKKASKTGNARKATKTANRKTNVSVAKKKTLNAHVEWKMENSINEPDLEAIAKTNSIQGLRLVEVPEGFHVYATILTVTLAARELFLATRRNRDEPRLFKDISRLVAFIKQKYPRVKAVSLELNAAVKATVLERVPTGKNRTKGRVKPFTKKG